MVVGGGDGDHLGDAEAGQHGVRRAGELGGVDHGADADDRSLPGHEPRNRLGCADAPGVRERDGGSREVVDSQGAFAPAAHEVLVSGEEIAESHELGGFDGRHDEGAGAVGAAGVDRDAEIDVLGMADRGLAVGQRVRVVHLGHLDERLNRGEGHQVGEADLAAPGGPQPLVDDGAVVEHRFGGDFAERRRRRNGERGVHVGRDGLGRALHADGFAGRDRGVARHQLVPFGIGGEGRLRRGRRSGREVRTGGDRVRGRLPGVAPGVNLDLRLGGVGIRPSVHGAPLGAPSSEKVAPLRRDGRRILEEVGVEILDEAAVGPEVVVWLR